MKVKLERGKMSYGSGATLHVDDIIEVAGGPGDTGLDLFKYAVQEGDGVQVVLRDRGKLETFYVGRRSDGGVRETTRLTTRGGVVSLRRPGQVVLGIVGTDTDLRDDVELVTYDGGEVPKRRGKK